MRDGTSGDPTDSAIEAVIDAGRVAASRGWVPATSGNFSVRAGDLVAITRTGRDKGNMTRADVAVVSPVVPSATGLSAESELHFARYLADPSIGAVFHVHMTLAAVLGRRCESDRQLILSGWELQKAFPGVRDHQVRLRVPIVPNSQDMPALAAAIEAEAARPYDGVTAPGCIVAGHGIYAWGRTPAEVQKYLEAFEGLFELHVRWSELSK